MNQPPEFKSAEEAIKCLENSTIGPEFRAIGYLFRWKYQGQEDLDTSPCDKQEPESTGFWSWLGF